MKLFLRLTLLACLLFPALSAMANTGSKTYYSKVTAKAETGKGLVYVSTTELNPEEINFTAETDSKTASGSNQEIPFYIYAKPLIEGEVFKHWLDNSGNIVEGNLVSPAATSEKEGTPTEFSYTAVFGALEGLSLSSNMPMTIIKSVPDAANVKVGDEVTLTASLKFDWLGNTNYQPSLLHIFDGWYDQSDNCVSKEESFKYTYEKPVKLEARYKYIGEKPRNGGYYRIRNEVNRVLTLEGNFKLNIGLSGVNCPMSLLRWACPDNHDFNAFPIFTTGNRYPSDDDPGVNVESMPSTIFYITGTDDGSNLKNVYLSGQGVDTKTLMGNALTAKPMKADYIPGYYYLFAMSSIKGDAGVKMTLNYNEGGCIVYVGNVKPTDSYSAMAFQPIDEEHLDYFWFGAKPDEALTFEGGYWTSMYTGFPYECRDGVEAYYVKETVTANGDAYARLVKIEEGIVPAKTAVLLKCQGLDTKENRLLPLAPDAAVPTITGNALKGEFQLYTKEDKSAGRVKYDESTMRVLGVNSKGEVGFFKLAPGEDGTAQELTANKVYLDMTALPASALASSFKLMSDGNATGIENIEETGESVKFEKEKIYDLNGRIVVRPEAGGIYIVGGKKVIWK